MRRAALAIAVFLACAGVGGTFAAFYDSTSSSGSTFTAADSFLEFVQHVGSASCGGTSDVVNVAAGGVAAGNTLVVWVALRDGDIGSFTPSMSDSQGNSYTRDVDQISTSVRAVVFSAYVGTALAAGDTITLTHPAVDASAMSVHEFSGVASTSRLDQTAANAGSSANPTATVTTTNGYDLIAGAVANNQTEGVTQPGGWSGIAKVTGDCGGASAQVTVNGAWRIESPTGSFTYDPVLPVGRQWADVLASYRG